MMERLKRFASDGRGLWVGLFLPTYPRPKHPIMSFLPDDAHLTLLHLGKNRKPEDVEALCETVAAVWRMDVRPLTLEITGVGWFWRRRDPTLVALVNSARIFAMRSVLISMLGDRKIVPNDAYGFIPHVTLDNERDEKNEMIRTPWTLSQSLSHGPVVAIEIPTITVVCGDGSLSVS